MDNHVIHNAIAWNRARMEHALKARNSKTKEVAIAACQDAQRHANNITRLEARLGE